MNLTVVGLGYVGLPLAILAAKHGFKVTGFDIDPQKVLELSNGITFSPDINAQEILGLLKTNNLSLTTKLEPKSGGSIFVIAVPTPLNDKRLPDLSMLENACELITEVICDGDLVITESTSYIGTLRNVIQPIFEGKTGLRNIDFAVAPERIDPGNKKWHLSNTPRNVAGITQKAGERAAEFYANFCESVNLLTSPEEAEAAKLIENTFRQVNIAFVNELIPVAEKLNFSLHNAIEAAAHKPFGYMPFYPSIGVGGHCIPIDPNYLTYSAQQVGGELRLVSEANSINLNMPNVIVEKIKNKLNFDFIGKKIQVAGIAYKSNSSDTRESPAIELIQLLRERGAEVTWHDPLVGKYRGELSVTLNDNIDLGLIITPHQEIDFTSWKKSNLLILDLSANSENHGWAKFL
jgi:UDP-N-acetyl-D-glucosamine dehydrogenase